MTETSKITITEGLAEVKTIEKKLEKKTQFCLDYLAREEKLKDPLYKDGGSAEAIRRERQAIKDLQERVVSIRRAVLVANAQTSITIEGVDRSIQDWLTWRREVAPAEQKFLGALRQKVNSVRSVAAKNSRGVVTTTREGVSSSQEIAEGDIHINIDESDLAKESEQLENILGQLDGQLSLKNATTFIEF